MGEEGQQHVVEDDLVAVVEVPLRLVVVVLLETLQVAFSLTPGDSHQHRDGGLPEYVGLDLN